MCDIGVIGYRLYHLIVQSSSNHKNNCILSQTTKHHLDIITLWLFHIIAVIIDQCVHLQNQQHQIPPINQPPPTHTQYISMDDSHIGHATQQLTTIKQEEDYLQMNLDSELLLSHISYQSQPDSPLVNINAVQAKIKELTKTADPPIIKKSKPYCGCGQYYSCTSSLYLHIRSKHGGIAPPNTIGGPKGIVKKPNPPNYQQVKVEQTDQTKYNIYQPTKSSTQSTPNTTMNSTVSTVTQQQKIMNNSQPVYYSGQINRGDQQKKSCKICGKLYSCNSSLNLHLKKKHQVRRLQDGRIEVQARPEERQPKNFQCTICGLNYGSKSALGLHYNNKHNAKTGNDQLPYGDGHIQKCGCGLIYQSRSALNMHVKKKHGGEYPQGTSQKPNLRGKGRSSQNYVFQGSQEQKHSIFDSQSEEGGHSHPKYDSLAMPVVPEKIFKCGCGRNYSCSSSLNLHIKKNHNWMVPKGTIGGPRGMRNEQQRRYYQPEPTKPVESSLSKQDQNVQCGQCSKQVKKQPYFQCHNCQKQHFLCSECFWVKDNFNEQHGWHMVQTKQNK